jgi:hypothetical protein
MPRHVRIIAASLFCPAGIGIFGLGPAVPGPVPGFDPIACGVPRKHLKTMTRAVQLGVAGVNAALAIAPGWTEIPPERRGLFVGASPQAGDAEDLAPALAAAGGDPGKFAREGLPLIPPLWLVKGLSNNVLGYASAQHDLRGDNGNWCDGPLGGANALAQAVHAVAEGRVDLAIAGAADSLVGAESVVGGPCAEGAAFIVLVAGERGDAVVTAGIPNEDGVEEGFGALGAAAVPVAWVRAWLTDRRADIGGVRGAWSS